MRASNILCGVLTLITPLVARAQAPATIADTVWINGGSMGSGRYRGVTWYKADGSYQGLFSTSIVGSMRTQDSGVSGSYQYTPLESLAYDNIYTPYNATLTTQTDGLGPSSRVLDFTTATTATTGTGPNVFNSFTVLHRIPFAGGANSSINASVSAGHPATLGFVVSGTPLMLLRVVGPSLQNYGVSDFLPLPSVTVYSGSQAVIPDPYLPLAGPWRADPGSGGSAPPIAGSTLAGYQTLFGMVSAFPLTPGAGDWAMLLQLSPGAYTLVATAPAGSQGQVLCEVYYLPYAQ